MSDKSPLLQEQQESGPNGTIQGHPTQPQEIEDDKIKLTKLRWYILALFCAMGFMQNLIWNTWGPIAQSAELVFGWEDSTIALMSNWGPIAYVTTALLFSWLMDVKGLRIACIISMLCMTVGSAIRCAAVNKNAATWVIHLGQLLNGIGGPVIGGAPPLLSAIWFPVHQRTTSTAISSSVGIMGTALSFVVGPAVVRDIENKTECENASSSLYNESHCDHKIHQMHSQIMMLIYVEAAVTAVIFFLTLVYFPAKPKHSPSITASIKRTDFLKGILDLARNGKFWMLAVPYAVSSGVFQCWLSVLDVNLKPSGITEHTAGFIGFWSTMAGQVAAIVIGISADVFAKKMKVMFISLYTLATVVFLIFTFQCTNIIPMYTALMYTTCILGSMCLFATVPLFYELGCESSYPVAEGITNTAMTFLLNAAGLVFLLVFMIPNIGTSWTNWTLVGSVAGCLPIFVFFKAHYRRFDIDIVIEKEVTAES